MGIFQKIKDKKTDRTHPPYIKNGYKQVYRPESPSARYDGYAPEHRVIIERALKNRVPKDCVVHHINENKLDNRLKNLEIQTKGEHYKTHRMWRYKKNK